MAKQLIIVVHGVGVKEAGVSADLLATALDDTPEENTSLSRTDIKASRLRPHSSDDFHLREKIEYNSGGKRQVFPARIRRYRHNDDKSGKLLNERVVADFYWGDISNIASGLPGLLLGILTTILGLSHIIRENALSVFPGNGAYEWTMRRIANMAALTIHGPIAAINIVLLLGVFINFGIRVMGWPASSAAIWVTGMVSAACGLYLSRRSDVFLMRLFGGWMVVVAFVLLILWMFFPDNGVGLAAIGGISDAKIVEQVCPETNKSAAGACTTSMVGIYLQGLRLVTLMGYMWLVVILSGIVIGIGEIVRALNGQRQSPASIVMPAISLMTLLWVLMIGAIWSIIAGAQEALIPSSVSLKAPLGSLVYCIAGLVGIAVGALISFVAARRWANKFTPSKYINPSDRSTADGLANAHRLIVSGFILWPIRVFFIALALSALAQTSKFYDIEIPASEFIASLTDISNETFGKALLLLATLGTFAAVAGQQQLRAGLGIAIDVITWLNDHSWNSAERNTKSTSTVFERTLPRLFPTRAGSKQQGYWRRERIKQRLEVLATQLMRDERPDQLTIVSHSQGTVVALDVLNTQGRQWQSMMPKDGKISLATLGSPYTHVHQHYFPQAFSQVSALDPLASVQNGGILTDWINIFRIDDFVGTHLDPTGQWPREHPVPANGHTHYWIDEKVFPILKKFVG